MTEQNVEAGNEHAQAAAGPPPADNALSRSGLVDQSKSPLRQFLDKITHFVTGSSSDKRG
jgi:hypothetical protein